MNAFYYVHSFWFFYASVFLMKIRPSGAVSWYTDLIVRGEASGEQGRLPAHLERSISIKVSDSVVCALDRVAIHWNSSITSSVDSLSIAISHVGGSEASLADLTQTITESNSSGTQYQLIQCDINSDHCFPKVISISAQPENLKLVLNFESNTTQVLLLDAMAISHALHFTPVLQLDGAAASWTTSDRLEIQLSQSDLDTIMTAHSAGELIEVLPRTVPRAEQRGSVTVRPTEPGNYEVVVVDRSVSNSVLSWREAPPQLIQVQLCDDAAVLPKLPSARKLDLRPSHAVQLESSGGRIIQSTVAKRTVQVQGPLAISGLDPLKFAHDVTDPEVIPLLQFIVHYLCCSSRYLFLSLEYRHVECIGLGAAAAGPHRLFPRLSAQGQR